MHLGGASLNSGDVFILDNGAKIFVWTGASASPLEKNKALTHTIALRDDKDHQGKSQVGPLGRHSRCYGRLVPCR